METLAPSHPLIAKRWIVPDRIGVVASVLCAIHCALTPILLLMLPTFGRAWSHPATHWGMALVVIPVAAFTIVRGFQQHGRRWIVGVGVLGMALILVGAAVPYLKDSPVAAGGSLGPSSAPGLAMASMAEEDAEGGSSAECEREEPCASTCESESDDHCAMESASAAEETSMADCEEDLCCPTLQASADGGWTLHIPMASMLTTLGGLSLIAAHLGNLSCCAACRKSDLIGK